MIDWLNSISFGHFEFHSPYYFLLLLALPAYFLWLKRNNRKGRGPVFRVSSLESFQMDQKGRRKIKMLKALPWLCSLAFLFMVTALARPRISNLDQNIESDGIDIVLSMDVSGSMLAEDLKPTRLDAARSVAKKFIDDRPGDRIGLVIFAGESFTQCPVTIDHNILKEQLDNINAGMLNPGTAIGSGLATAVDRLRKSNSKSKVIILMTDGVYNVGLSPQTAMQIAQTYGIRVYCIGLGTNGQALTPDFGPDGKTIIKKLEPVTIDEALLRTIAQTTGGKYFRATDNQSLENIYNEIDKMEKTTAQIDSKRRFTELFFPFGIMAILLMVYIFCLKTGTLKTVY